VVNKNSVSLVKKLITHGTAILVDFNDAINYVRAHLGVNSKTWQAAS
jgi:hypothetical protein